MYYDEQWIDGVLCSRTTPDGEWVPLPAAKLMARLREAQARMHLTHEEV